MSEARSHESWEEQRTATKCTQTCIKRKGKGEGEGDGNCGLTLLPQDRDCGNQPKPQLKQVGNLQQRKKKDQEWDRVKQSLELL
jgi:hypothetical protein